MYYNPLDYFKKYDKLLCTYLHFKLYVKQKKIKTELDLYL